MTPFLRRSLTTAFAAAGLLFSAGCQRGNKAQAAAQPPVPVQMAVAQQRDVPRQTEAVGNVQAVRTVAIKSQVDGIIAGINFREGDEVKAGELLVSLDRRPFENALRIARADLETARAEAAQAEADVERYSRLEQVDAIAKEQLIQLQTKQTTTQALVQAKQAAVANAELQLSYTQIRAPIPGRTGQLLLHEGALVKANDVNQSIVTVNQLTPILVAFAVPEKTLPVIRTAVAAGAATVSVVDHASGAERADGKLVFVDNAVDATTGTITLKAEFPNDDHALWPGQFVQTRLTTGVDRNAIVVPSSAVQVGQDNAQVFVVKADRSVELRPVEVIRTSGEFTVLGKGVQQGETVVTDGQLRLVPGAKVEAKSLGGVKSDATAQSSP
jgi:multidrug efflux system membrane fusion protein